MRERKGSTVGNKFGYLVAIPFNQNVWFKFLGDFQYRMEQHFRDVPYLFD